MKSRGLVLILLVTFLSGITWDLYEFFTDRSLAHAVIFSQVPCLLLFWWVYSSFNKGLTLAEENYIQMLELSPDTIFIYVGDKIVYINEAGKKLMGTSSSSELIGQSIFHSIPQDQKENLVRRMKMVQEESIVHFEERKIINLHGEQIDVETLAAPITYQGKKAVQVIVRELTERKKTEEKMRYMAHYDSLTGLPNRNFMKKYFKELLTRSSYNRQLFAVLFLDLDRFKMINDTKGHSFGDLVLQEVPRILQRSIKNSYMFRYGGDEFVILLENIQGQEQITAVSRRIIDEFSTPMIINGQEIFVTPSIGISTYPNNGDDAETLLKHADTAMYVAKERGKNNYQFYTYHLHDKISRKMEIENELRKALENNEFMLHYQPQVEIDSNKIIGIESLIRWNHPRLGIISPSEFIPIAEDTGQIVPLGDWILRTACLQNKAWQDAGYPKVPVSVNFSMKQFDQSNLIGGVFKILKDTGLHPKYLCLEITETIAQHNIERMIRKIQDLKNLGIKISIDDFGTGYSSLSYLKKFAIDTLKIDQSFVRDIAIDINDMAIVTTIISMSKILNFNVIAEGVETKEQLMFLRNKGCREVQGYYYSEPLPPTLIEQKYFIDLHGYVGVGAPPEK